jgi:transcriptional regulator with XRE-family HTH domain
MNSHQTSSFGDLLKLFRQRKKLSQQLLANKIEVHRNSISLWERDMERPETFSTLLHLATVLGLDEEEKRILIETRFGTTSFLSFSNIPFSRNPYFTGREYFLEDLLLLRKQLSDWGASAKRSWQLSMYIAIRIVITRSSGSLLMLLKQLSMPLWRRQGTCGCQRETRTMSSGLWLRSNVGSVHMQDGYSFLIISKILV